MSAADLRPECPGPDCPLCSGEACRKCGAGCWNNTARDCEHDVIERHQSPAIPGAMGATEDAT